MNTKKIKILHLVLSLECGGAERIVSHLVSKGTNRGFEHSVCCLDRLGEFGEELKSSGHEVKILRRHPGIDWLLPLKLARYFRNKKIDIVHAHGESPWFYGALACIFYFSGKTRCLTTIHGYGGDNRTELPGYNLWRLLTAISKKVVLVAEIFHQELLQHNFPHSKLTTICNGVNLENTLQESVILRSNWGISDSDTVIGIIARLSPIKNHRLLFQALIQLHHTRDIIKLLVVGDGPIRQELETLAKELSVGGKIIFTGGRTDAVDFLSLFDLFVLPSLSEGVSMTILEAMAAKVPVIASAVGGTLEIIRHKETGLLFKSDDLQDLSDNLRLLLDDPQLGQKMADDAFEMVQSNFSFERMMLRYEALYLDSIA